ncbi:MAG TPA: NUDIX domain-containing protein [Thermoplasmata archaeon]|nr:NUDIX domain-containing protein [Thermoplasmata archaeon]
MALNVATLPITVGVGAFLVHDGRLLVVKRTYGTIKGLWSIPSGYVEPHESVLMTLEREVQEETGVVGRAGPLLGMRNRVTQDVNDTFLIFRMEYVSGEPRPDALEVSAAAFLPADELMTSPESAPFTRAAIERFLRAEGMHLDSYIPPAPLKPGEYYLLFR